ncbi:MAG: PleD family two-component system response regulator, partial [Acidobacteriota bacterium]
MARLLIADNSPFYRELVGKAMEQAGYEVRLASDGLEALRVLASERFDAVILDLVMPRVGGARACRQIKADPLTAHLPVIILSGLREE